MNYYYLTFLVIMFIIAVVSFIKVCDLDGCPYWVVLWISSWFILAIVFGLGFDNYSVSKQEKRLSVAMETFDRIALKAIDWPEILTSDVQALNKPMYIIRTESVNQFGMGKRVEYTCEVVPIEESK